MLDQAGDSLQSCVGQVADLYKRKCYLFGSETAPAFAMEHFIESSDSFEIGEVDKAVALVGAAFRITREVQKVVIVAKLSVNLFRQVLNRVLIGDVLDHESRSGIFSKSFRADDEFS